MKQLSMEQIKKFINHRIQNCDIRRNIKYRCPLCSNLSDKPYSVHKCNGNIRKHYRKKDNVIFEMIELNWVEVILWKTKKRNREKAKEQK